MNTRAQQTSEIRAVVHDKKRPGLTAERGNLLRLLEPIFCKRAFVSVLDDSYPRSQKSGTSGRRLKSPGFIGLCIENRVKPRKATNYRNTRSPTCPRPGSIQTQLARRTVSNRSSRCRMQYGSPRRSWDGCSGPANSLDIHNCGLVIVCISSGLLRGCYNAEAAAQRLAKAADVGEAGSSRRLQKPRRRQTRPRQVRSVLSQRGHRTTYLHCAARSTSAGDGLPRLP